MPENQRMINTMETMMIKKISFFILTGLLFLPVWGYAQTCESAIMATAPDGRYTNKGNGTVTDSVTGLMWKQCSEGQSGSDCGSGNVSPHTWQGALQIPEALNASGGFAGYSDWRLPNNKELASLAEEQCYGPAINLALFPNTQSAPYWSALPNAKFSWSAWGVDFYDGDDGSYNRDSDRCVRLVRAGQ